MLISIAISKILPFVQSIFSKQLVEIRQRGNTNYKYGEKTEGPEQFWHIEWERSCVKWTHEQWFIDCVISGQNGYSRLFDYFSEFRGTYHNALNINFSFCYVFALHQVSTHDLALQLSLQLSHVRVSAIFYRYRSLKKTNIKYNEHCEHNS